MANLTHVPNVAHTYVEGMLSKKNILEAWEVCNIPANKTCEVPGTFVINGTLTVDGLVLGDNGAPVIPTPTAVLLYSWSNLGGF